MTPSLELFWRDVHASLIVYAREALQTQLPPGMVARVRGTGREADYRDLHRDCQHGGHRVITISEVLGVANKRPEVGPEVYLRKQRATLEADVNLVEIDLLRSGQWVLRVPLGKITPERRTPYFVVVYRTGQPNRQEVYSIALNQRLP